MRNIRYTEEEIKLKFKKNIKTEIAVKENLTYKEKLIRYRQQLIDLVLGIIEDKGKIKLINPHDEIKFLKEYKSYVLKTKMLYPTFIFDEFDEMKFSECVELKEQGYTLEQIEEYYLKNLRNKEYGKKYCI